MCAFQLTELEGQYDHEGISTFGRPRPSQGLIIPDTAKEKPLEGVLAVGPGVRDESGRIIPLEVKVGDHVLFADRRGLSLNSPIFWA
jgi:Chaperonin 10 Kd subunit